MTISSKNKPYVHEPNQLITSNRADTGKAPPKRGLFKKGKKMNTTIIQILFFLIMLLCSTPAY